MAKLVRTDSKAGPTRRTSAERSSGAKARFNADVDLAVDTSASTQIARMDVFIVDPRWRKKLVFTRVETRGGAVGWGEAYTQYDRDTAIVALLNELGRYLAGRSIFAIKNFLQIAF